MAHEGCCAMRKNCFIYTCLEGSDAQHWICKMKSGNTKSQVGNAAVCSSSNRSDGYRDDESNKLII